MQSVLRNFWEILRNFLELLKNWLEILRMFLFLINSKKCLRISKTILRNSTNGLRSSKKCLRNSKNILRMSKKSLRNSKTFLRISRTCLRNAEKFVRMFTDVCFGHIISRRHEVCSWPTSDLAKPCRSLTHLKRKHAFRTTNINVFATSRVVMCCLYLQRTSVWKS